MARSNLQALEVLARLGSDRDTPLHPGHRAALEQWAGWGPMAKAFDPYERTPAWQQLAARLRDLLTPEEGTAAQQATPTSFYTSPMVTAAIWRLLLGLGFAGGQVLEPGCGSGLFMAATPPGLPVTWTGVDRDPVSARIAGLLHPRARIIAAPLERVSLPPAGFDAAIGNVPFADVIPYDPTAPKKLSLHTYFIYRAVQAVRPGGLIAVVTSRYTLDGEDRRVRELLAEDADLLGAVRLPTGAFHEYGTDVVTDIVVLRRRSSPRAEGRPAPPWLGAQRQPELRTAVSRYFLTHPEQVLGRLEPVGGAYHGHILQVSFEGDRDTLEAALTAALDRIVTTAAQQHQLYTPRRDPTAIPSDVALTDKDGRKDGSFHLINGVVHQVNEGRLERLPRAGAELQALIRLRDAALALLDAEANPDTPDTALAPLRTTLNRRYDRYVAAHGPLNRCTLIQGPPDEDTGLPTWSRRRPTMGGFRDDPDYVTVLALELYDDDTRSASKAPIFHQRVNRRPQRPQRARNAADAVALCLDEHGHLDPATLARLLDIDPAEVPGALADLAYHDPTEQHLVPADEYLSGNVRHKLDLARVAATNDPARYARNVAALEAVQPTDLGPEDIKAKLGAPWVEARDVQAFLTETVGGRVTVRHAPLVASWEIKVADRWEATSAAATAEWGTGRFNAYELVQLACNGGAPTVYDEIERPDGSTTRVRNVPETMLAEAKLQALNERFGVWLWEDDERTQRLVSVYNRRYNATVLRRFDGSHLTFPGLADWFVPYDAQRDIAYRIAATTAALCGFVVGGGKTAAMFMSAVTLRRLGLASKPMIICPNHLLEDTAREGKRLFPNANILMVSREDLGKERRKRFAARCAMGDWDAVVITQSAFTALAMHPETEAAWLATQIELYRNAAMALAEDEERPSRTVKQIAKQADRLEARQRELLDHRTDDGVTFEQLGVDYLLVDEAHYFKRLGFPTRMEGFNIEASKRATDLALKLWWLLDRNDGGRSGAFFTGTPISNSLAEIFVLLTYLMPQRLSELGIDSFDGFAGMFIEFLTQIEVAPDGGSFRLHRRPAKFMNVPELRMLLGEIADIRTRAMLGLVTPDAEFDTVVVPASPELKAFVATLVQRADKIRAGGLSKRDDNMLSVCNDGRKAALDLELVGIPTTDPGKVGAVVDRVTAIWRATADNLYPGKDGDPSPTPGALQIVFCDLGTPNRKRGTQVYGKIRRDLIAAGVPADRVRFVHGAKTDAAKAALFADCRAGRVSVLLGSTDKLGVGTNIQDRCVAVHHVDAPWRPADVEQREGRALRPGNHNRRVQVIRYVTEGSFDSYMWQTLERKARFIAQILTGRLTAREVEDIDTSALSFAEVKALATGQPLLLEAASVAAEIARLKQLAAGHTRAQRRVRDDINRLLRDAGTYQERAEALDAIAAHAGEHEPVFSSYGGKPLGDRAAIAKALAAAAATGLQKGSSQHPGQWSGMSIQITPTQGWRDASLEVTVSVGYRHSASFDMPKSWLQQGQVWRIVDALERLVEGASAEAIELRDAATVNRARAADSEALVGRPFEHAGRLQEALDRQQAIDKAMRDQAEATASQGAPAASELAAAPAPVG